MIFRDYVKQDSKNTREKINKLPDQLIITLSVLTIMLMVAGFTICASEETEGVDSPSISGSCGEQIHWTYDADQKLLIISGTGEMKKGGSSEWGTRTSGYTTYTMHLDTVKIQGSIDNIGGYAFKGLCFFASIFA